MNKVLKFLRKYWLCFLLSFIMVIGIDLSACFADIYISGSVYSMIRFDFSALYNIFGLPLFGLLYGCLTYAILKKAWIPQLILFVITFLYWFRFEINELLFPGT